MGSFSSSRLIEQVANDDGNTLDEPPSRLASKLRANEAGSGTEPEALDSNHRRLSDRIASIKPVGSAVAGDTIPPNQRIAIALPVSYRVTEAISLADLMRRPEPVVAAPASAPPSSPDKEAEEAPLDDSLSTRLADTPVVSEADPFTTGSRLAALLREQRELLEDLARISVHMAPPADDPSSSAAKSDATETTQSPHDQAGAEAETSAAVEPAVQRVPAVAPGAARTAEDIIKALAAVVETQPMHVEAKADDTPNAEPRDLPALTAPRPDYRDQDYAIAPMVHTTTLNRSSQLVHNPEPLGLASLIDEERPPMIIERAYTSLPGLDSDRDLLPRAPGFLAGMALSGVAGIALFFALRVT